ncbi:MAG: hypothetical protein EOO28_16615 [Comamonadaceae bacterium]|nr:MAG: hypothetical protein EOO28_16615 [Comamonadaceae bacterium]
MANGFSKTPGIILAEIAMIRSAFSGSFLLVEGDTDSRFWNAHVSHQDVCIVNCEGKPNLVAAAQSAEAAGHTDIIGVYDPDFDKLTGVVHCPNRLVATDHNDLDITLLTSPSSVKVLREYADAAKVAAFEAGTQLNVFDHVEKLSREFGRLRFLNEVNGYGVDFDKLSPHRFWAGPGWQIDVAALHQEFSGLANLPPADLQQLLAGQVVGEERWNLSQGHDAMRILAHGLKHHIGKKQLSEEDLGRVMRIGFDADCLRRTRMLAELRGLQESLGIVVIA